MRELNQGAVARVQAAGTKKDNIVAIMGDDIVT